MVLIAAGLALAIAGQSATSVRPGTHVNPWKPSTALVTDGIFGWLRNPMYVGVALLVCRDLPFSLASDWMLVMIVVVCAW